MRQKVLITPRECQLLAEATDCWLEGAIIGGGPRLSVVQALCIKPLERLVPRLRRTYLRRRSTSGLSFFFTLELDEMIALQYCLYRDGKTIELVAVLGKVHQRLINYSNQIELP